MFPHDCRDSNLTNINIAATNIPTSTFDPGPRNTTSGSEPEEPRMIGDFDEGSKGLWKLFRDEAKSHDGAQTDTLKDDMGNSLVFVRSYPIRIYDGPGRTDTWPHRLVYFPLSSLRS